MQSSYAAQGLYIGQIDTSYSSITLHASTGTYINFYEA